MKKWFIDAMTLLICLSFAVKAYSVSAESSRQVKTQNTAKQSGTTLETIYTIKALKNIDFPNKKKVIGSAIGYLKKSQNKDGGWGLREGDKSNGKITAEIIVGLQLFKDEYKLKDTLRKANDYILSLKNSDGSWKQ